MKVVEAKRDRLREKLVGIVQMLHGDVTSRVTHRAALEAEWTEDLDQYHGLYDHVTRGKMALDENAGKSKLFINKTLEKTNATIARMEDVLFPTDDRNWGVQATPVPEMDRQADNASAQVAELEGQGEAADPAQLNAATTMADQLAAIKKAADDQADLMQDEIADQLEECRYQAKCRDMLEDGCKIGTGIMEGPVSNDSVRRGWEKGEDGKYVLRINGDPRPSMHRIDPWNWFPSTGATCVEDSEGFFVRHLWTTKQLRAFAKVPGVNKHALRRLIELGPRDTLPDRLRKNSSTASIDTLERIYTVWKYCGPLTAEHMETLALHSEDYDTANEMGDVDPLDEVNAIIWFCGDEVLKFSIYPFDSGEPMFSVWCYQKSEGSIWGYGVPRVMRDSQKSLNAAWRMMMDNGDLSAGSQILVDTRKVRPVGGDMTLRGRKLWESIPGAALTGNEFQTFDIPSHQQEMANIIEMSYRQIDDVTNLPQVAQGERGVVPQQTATGMVILANMLNVLFRRAVRNFDDDMTVPNIRRMYDWNMQFGKDEIKGDYQISARGSSVLLVREMQAQNVTSVALNFGADPEYAAIMKKPEMFREVLRSLMLPPAKFAKSDAEVDKAMREAAEAAQPEVPAGPDPAVEMTKLEIERERIQLERDALDAKIAIAEMEHDSRIKVAELHRETEMMRLAETMNMTSEKLEADMEAKRADRRAKERGLATEVAIRSSEQAPLNQTQVANT